MAITWVEGVIGSTGYPPNPVAFGVAPVAKDVFWCNVNLVAGTNPVSVSISDTLNGPWNQVLGAYNATYGIWNAAYWIISAAGAAPTVSATLGSDVDGTILLGHATGFIGTPTLDSALSAQSFGTATTLSLSPITTNFANELLLLGVIPIGLNGLSTPGSWTPMQIVSESAYSLYAIEPTAGTTNNYSASVGTSQDWGINVIGIYDKPATGGAAPIAWVT